jgi:hypothetical protein
MRRVKFTTFTNQQEAFMVFRRVFRIAAAMMTGIDCMVIAFADISGSDETIKTFSLFPYTI